MFMQNFRKGNSFFFNLINFGNLISCPDIEECSMAIIMCFVCLLCSDILFMWSFCVQVCVFVCVCARACVCVYVSYSVLNSVAQRVNDNECWVLRSLCFQYELKNTAFWLNLGFGRPCMLHRVWIKRLIRTEMDLHVLCLNFDVLETLLPQLTVIQCLSAQILHLYLTENKSRDFCNEDYLHLKQEIPIYWEAPCFSNKCTAQF